MKDFLSGIKEVPFIIWRKVKEFCRKVKMICEYDCYLWNNDVDWDWTSIIELLAYKIDRVRRCIKKNSIIAQSEIDTIESETLLISTLLRRVTSESAYTDAIEYDLKLKYGNFELVGEVVKEDGHSIYRVTWKFENDTLTDQQKKEFVEEYHRRMDEVFGYVLQQKDLKAAFDVMLDKIWTWWD